jgi:hypothetical protein
VLRAYWWATDVFCVIAKNSVDEQLTSVMSSWIELDDEVEGRFKDDGWLAFVDTMEPSDHDYVISLEGDEVVWEHDTLVRAVIEHSGMVMPLTVYQMWDRNHFRIDPPYAPRALEMVYPYREARWTSRDRLPSNIKLQPKLGLPVGSVLKYTKGAGEPDLEEWTRGGLMRI